MKETDGLLLTLTLFIFHSLYTVQLIPFILHCSSTLLYCTLSVLPLLVFHPLYSSCSYSPTLTHTVLLPPPLYYLPPLPPHCSSSLPLYSHCFLPFLTMFCSPIYSQCFPLFPYFIYSFSHHFTHNVFFLPITLLTVLPTQTHYSSFPS